MYTGLTKAGEIYLANRLANKLPVNFLKVKIGNGTVPHGADASETTELYSFKKEIQILDITQTDNVARIRVLIDNSDVEQGFFMKELGVYVDDNGKEKLYWYVYEDNGQYVHSKTERAIQFDLELVMEVTSSNSTILDWNKDKVWISKNYFDEKVRTFEIPTIAELQSRKNLKVGDIVEVLGYYTAGDGAGHKRIIANKDDGTGVQLKNGLYANIVHNGEINIKWLGAKGDGINDDTDSFKTQFNLFVPVGTFLINNIIKMQSGNHLCGENMYDSVIKVGSDIDGIWVNTDCTLENLAFNCDLETYNSDVIKIGDDTFTKQGKIQSMCGVKVSNISSNFKMQNGTGNLFHILSSGFRQDGTKFPIGEGYWGLKITHVRYYGYFDRAFKIESKVWDKTINAPWLTYSTVSDVRGWKAITAIEGVSTFESGDYQSNNIVGNNLTIKMTFEDCNFESGERTKDGVISNGVCFKLNNFYLGDFHLGLPGYHRYKIYCYDKISEYGTFYFAGSGVDYDSLRKFFNLVNYKNDIEDFISRKINFVVESILKNDYIKNMLYYTLTPNEKNKKIVWIASVNKKDYSNAVILDKKIEFSLGYSSLSGNGLNSKMSEANFYYDYSDTAPMQVIINNANIIEFVYEENEEFVKLGIIHTPQTINMPNRKTFFLMSDQGGRVKLNKAISINDIDEVEYNKLKKCKIIQSGSFELYDNIDNLNLTGFNMIFQPRLNQLKIFNENNRKFYSINLIEEGTPAQLNTLYHLEKMKQENVYDDYISYMDEKTLYDKQQRNLEQERQLAYQEALKENPNLIYEQFMSLQAMTLNLIEEPQPSEALKQFMEKYLYR